MPKQLLVRNVPDDIGQWIDDSCKTHQVSQQHLVLSVLRKASESAQTPLLPFEEIRKEITVPGALPFRSLICSLGSGAFEWLLRNWAARAYSGPNGISIRKRLTSGGMGTRPMAIYAK